MFRFKDLLALVVWMLSFAAVHADIVPYGNFSGATVNFIGVTESSSSIGTGPGQVPHLYGPPTVAGDSLKFLPTLFEAKRLGTGVDLVDGQLSFQLTAKPGFKIVGISVEEFGDYTLATPFSGGQALVAASARGFALTPDGLFDDGFTFLDSSATPFGKFGLPWFGDFWISFPATNAVDFTMDNTLTAAAFLATDGAIIKKKGVTIFVHTEPIPIPEPGATAALIVMVALLHVARRRPGH